MRDQSQSSILVINPNSNAKVTDVIRRALAGVEARSSVRLECVTLHDGPREISSQCDIDLAAVQVAAFVRERNDAGAVVIACFSDPGVCALREYTSQPVFGIGESSILTALALGDRVALISLSDRSVRRHRRYLRARCLERRVVADVALNLDMSQLVSGGANDAVMAAGRRLMDQYRAEVIVLACAGMAVARRALETELCIPVVEPTHAAVTSALGALTRD